MSFEVANGSGEDKEIAFCKQTMFQSSHHLNHAGFPSVTGFQCKKGRIKYCIFFPFFFRKTYSYEDFQSSYAIFYSSL